MLPDDRMIHRTGVMKRQNKGVTVNRYSIRPEGPLQVLKAGEQKTQNQKNREPINERDYKLIY